MYVSKYVSILISIIIIIVIVIDIVEVHGIQTVGVEVISSRPFGPNDG